MDATQLLEQQRSMGRVFPVPNAEGREHASGVHLLQYLGRHRDFLNKRIVAALGCEEVHWLDFLTRRDKYGQPHDAQWKHLDFLPGGSPARKSWPEFWPEGENQPNWDSVGVAAFKHGDEWLLVEAKSHTGELKSSFSASSGYPLIEQSLKRTKQRLGVLPGRDWLNGYYHYCSRLALLNFLTEKGVSARLLFIYFVATETADSSGGSLSTAEEWHISLSELDQHVGLAPHRPLKARVHQVFLPVFPSSSH